MPTLHFTVSASLVLGGTSHEISQVSQPLSASSDATPVLDHYGGSPTANAFYLHSWIGGGSSSMSTSVVRPDGSADVKMDIAAGDVNTVKLEYDFVTPSTNGPRVHQLCSSFIPVADLMAHLDGTSKVQHLFMQNNMVKNSAVLKFANVSTDVAQIRGLALRPSALLETERLNTTIFNMGKEMKAKLSTLTISPTNAGTNFVEPYSFYTMDKQLANYGMMGFTFQCLNTAATAEMTMYNAYQTLTSTGLSLDSLASMSDADLVTCFGTQLITRPTCCSLTTPYGPDVTMNLSGKVVLETESIDRSFSALALTAQVN